MKIDELCKIYHLNQADLQTFVDYEIITITVPLQEVQLDVTQINRIKTTIRLQRDLEVNVAGAAVILNLLDELNDLHARAAILEKHLLK